jgi:hypothetical protein
MSYFVSWIRDRRTSKFVLEHDTLDSALEFACQAFRIECTDVWITDHHGQKVADRVAVAQYADRHGLPYN